MKIGSKEFNPVLKISVIGRYASTRGIPLSRIDKLLTDMTMDDLVGLFVYAVTLQGGKLTTDEVYNEIDTRAEALSEIASSLSEQLSSGEQKLVKTSKKPR